MKTIMNASSLKRFAISVNLIAILTIVIIAQPNPENNNTEMASVANLEKLMNAAEHSIKYVAPDSFFYDDAMQAVSNKEAENAIRNLELLADKTEKKLQYRVNADNVEEALQNLEMLADITEKEIQYKAPVDMEQFALKIGKPLIIGLERYNRPEKVEVYYNMQDNWLINTGYYKSSKTPAWNKIKKLFSTKYANKEYASK